MRSMRLLRGATSMVSSRSLTWSNGGTIYSTSLLSTEVTGRFSGDCRKLYTNSCRWPQGHTDILKGEVGVRGLFKVLRHRLAMGQGRSLIVTRYTSNAAGDGPKFPRRGWFDNLTLDAHGKLRDNAAGKVRGLWKKYGVVAVTTYLSIYVGVLLAMYGVVSWYASGIQRRMTRVPSPEEEDREIATRVLKRMHLDKIIQPGSVGGGSFAVAWVITKFTEPIRLAVTLAITPRIARLVGKVPK